MASAVPVLITLKSVMNRGHAWRCAGPVLVLSATGTRALAATSRSDTPRRRLKVSLKIAPIGEQLDLEGLHP